MTSTVHRPWIAAGARATPAEILGWLDAVLSRAIGDKDAGTTTENGLGIGPPLPEVLESTAVALALGWELDARYGQLFAFLQAEPMSGPPTVGLVLELTCGDAADRLDALCRLSPGAALWDSGLVELGGAAGEPRHARAFRLGSLGRRLFLGDDALDERLAGTSVLEPPGGIRLIDLPLAGGTAERLLSVAERLAVGSAEHVQIVGTDDRLIARVAAAMASAAGLPVLRVAADRTADDLRGLVRREAAAAGAVLHLLTRDVLPDAWVELAGQVPAVMVSAPAEDHRLAAAGFTVLPVGPPSTGLRRGCWVECAAAVGVDLSAHQADRLAGSYRLGCSDIADAARLAAARSRGRGLPVPRLLDVQQAASELAGRGVAAVARRVEVVHRWEDLVLDPDVGEQLRELCSRVRTHERVLDDWALRRGSALARGTHALFSGPSGTGKTAAAQVVAAELGFQMWKVDLASVVSKYIGETEKNLDAIFCAAAGSDVVLFFDEADALFGKRSEVHDAHDRYANIEISYLLQRMEEHDGVTVLATNLRRNLDDAFLRRLAFDVRFPFPDEQQRLQIWQRAFPPEVPLAGGIDLVDLAAQYPLSGGQIRNVALAAAYLAAAGDGPVDEGKLRAAVRREFQKLGKDIG